MTRRWIAGILIAASCAGCGVPRNYADPTRPVFEGGTPPVPPAAMGDLRIVSFNLKFGARVDAAAGLLSAHGALHDADIIALQEMDLPGVDRLSRVLDRAYVYVPSAVHPSSRRDFGVAILSRWPMSDSQKLLLPHPHRFTHLQRAAAVTTIHTPLGAVRVYAVHLETAWGATNRVRRDQARAILADAARWPDPIVIAGDFNGAGGDQAVASAGFTWLTRRVGGTAGPLSLDHVFVRGLCASPGRNAGRGIDTRGISDHRAVWASVRRCTGQPR